MEAVLTASSTQYEKAVAALVERFVGKDTTVEWNKKVLDVRTQTKRQIDVWIETKIATHPFNIAISCKKWKEPITIDDVDTFAHTMKCVGAQSGIIFCSGGYSAPALQACRQEGISCCTIVCGDAGELPNTFDCNHYICGARWALTAFGNYCEANKSLLWKDFLETADESGCGSVGEILAVELNKLLNAAKVESITGEVRRSIQKGKYCSFVHSESKHTILVEIVAMWQVFRASSKTVLLDGLYNISENEYKGRICLVVDELFGSSNYYPVKEGPMGFGPLGFSMGEMTPATDEKAILNRYCDKPLWDITFSPQATLEFVRANGNGAFK